MNKKEFSKWIEKVEKEIGNKDLDLEGIQLSTNKSKVSSILAQVLQKPKPVPSFKKISKSSKSLTTLQNPAKLATPETSASLFRFKPEISKTSQELAKKLGPSSSRILAPKIRSSMDSLSCQTSQMNPYSSFNSINPLLTSSPLPSMVSQLSMASMTSFKTFNSFQSFQSTNSIQSTSQFEFNDKLKPKSIRPQDFEETARRMYDWNKARLERLRLNKETRDKQNLEICTFRPEIREKKKVEDVKPALRGVYKGKKGYSGKIVESEWKAVRDCEGDMQDLDEVEYEHALKRLHWELEAIVLRGKEKFELIIE